MDEQYVVALTDGLGRTHELMIIVNDGDADANTGIFGVVQSKVGGLFCACLVANQTNRLGWCVDQVGGVL